MIGSHPIKSYSTTQSVIALSSGEAEYYGMVKGGSLGLGIRSLAADLGVKANINLITDSTAAIGIASRKGLGKVRHIEVNQLWLQEKVNKGDLEIEKIAGEDNLADILTKHVEGSKREWNVKEMGQELVSGRHRLMPEVSG